MAQRKRPSLLIQKIVVRDHRSQKFPIEKISKVENAKDQVKNQFFENLIFLRIGQNGNFEKNFCYVPFNFCVTHPPPGTPLGQNENEDAVPRVGILFFVQFPERGKISQ